MIINTCQVAIVTDWCYRRSKASDVVLDMMPYIHCPLIDHTTPPCALRDRTSLARYHDDPAGRR